MNGDTTQCWPGLKWAWWNLVCTLAVTASVWSAEPMSAETAGSAMDQDDPSPAVKLVVESHDEEDHDSEGASQAFDVVKIGEDFTLEKDQVARDVVIIGGKATIHGTVRGDCVIVMGEAVIHGTLERDLVAVMAPTHLSSNAVIRRDAVVIGGTLQSDPGAEVGRQRHEVAIGSFMPDLRWVFSWVKNGVMMLRPLPPQVGWAWALAGFFLILYLILLLLFGKPVRACTDELEQRPVAAFFSGMLLFLLIGPLLLLLVMSVLGILAIPIVACAFVGCILFGKVAVYTYTGQQLGRQLGINALLHPVVAFLIGAVLFIGLYTIPLVGLVVWLALMPLGVGAALLAAVTSFRHDSTPQLPQGGHPLAPTAANCGIDPLGASTSLSVAMPVPSSAGTPSDASLLGSSGGGAPASISGSPAFARAGFWIRFWATFLDAILIFWLGGVLGPAVMLVWIAYHILMWTLKGTTVGGIVFGLKVVRLDGRPVDFATALVRSLSSCLSAAVLFVGFFWVGWSNDRQSWHDRIAGTVIIRVPKGMSLV